MSGAVAAGEGDLAATYLRFAAEALTKLQSQVPRIHRAGDLLAETWRHGGTLVVPRTGHTLHTELVGRAGGPGAVRVLEDHRSFDQPTDTLVGVGRSDLLLIHANNSAAVKPVSIAEQACARGTRVVLLTQPAWDGSDEVLDRSRQGVLRGLAAVTIELSGPVGDAALTLPGSTESLAPISGVSAVAAAWAIIARAAQVLAADDAEPRFLRSVYLRGAAQWNARVAGRGQT